jgi:hypothetical protein
LNAPYDFSACELAAAFSVWKQVCPTAWSGKKHGAGVEITWACDSPNAPLSSAMTKNPRTRDLTRIPTPLIIELTISCFMNERITVPLLDVAERQMVVPTVHPRTAEGTEVATIPMSGKLSRS